MPNLSFSKYLRNRSKRKNTKINTKSAQTELEQLNTYFNDNRYPFKVIDYILSVYVTTFLVDHIESSQDIKIEDIIKEIEKTLDVSNIRVIHQALGTQYIGLQVINPTSFDLSYQDCLTRVSAKDKLPIGMDTTNELICLSINELGNTIVVGSPKTRKTTLIKALVTSLILSNDDKSNSIVVLDNSYYHELSLFNKHCYVTNDINKSLSDLVKELDRRESLLNGQSFTSYNKDALKNGKATLTTLDVFIDEYKDEYERALLNLLSRGPKLGANIVISSSSFIPDFSRYLSSCIIFKVDDLVSTNLTRTKEANYLIGKGDAFIISRAIKREDPVRLVAPYINDKEIRRLLPAAQ